RVPVLPLVRYDGRAGWQGLVPSRADTTGRTAVDAGRGTPGAVSDFSRELEPDRIAEHLTATAQAQIRDVVEEIMLREDPQLWNDLPPQVKEIVFARVEQQLPSVG